MAKAPSELLLSSAPPPLFFRLPFFFLYAPGVNKREAPSGYKNHIIHEAFHAIAGVSLRVCVSVVNPLTKDFVFPNHLLIRLTVAVTIRGWWWWFGGGWLYA